GSAAKPLERLTRADDGANGGAAEILRPDLELENQVPTQAEAEYPGGDVGPKRALGKRQEQGGAEQASCPQQDHATDAADAADHGSPKDEPGDYLHAAYGTDRGGGSSGLEALTRHVGIHEHNGNIRRQ